MRMVGRAIGMAGRPGPNPRSKNRLSARDRFVYSRSFWPGKPGRREDTRVMDRVKRGGVTLAHITDAHAAPNGRRTAVLKDRSIEILSDLIEQVKERGVDCVLFGGDNIDNVRDGPSDLAAFLQLVNGLDRWLAIVGNHEAEDGRCGTSRISKSGFAHAAMGHGLSPERMSW